MMKMNRTTVKDIANVLGISVGTVSKALTGKKGISEETRKAVLDTAKSLGYRVNRVAQSLARNPICIGILAPSVWPEYYGSLQKGIQKELNMLHDGNVMSIYKYVSSLYSGEEVMDAIEELIDEGIDAIIICPAFDASYIDCLNRLEQLNIPVALLGTDLPGGKRLTCVRSDAKTAGRLAGEFMKYLISQNSTAVVLIGNKDMQDHKEKADGFMQELKEDCYKLGNVYETQDEPEVAYYLTRKILREIPDIGGIYIATGNSAAVCKCIVEHNMVGKIKVIATDIFSDIEDYIEQGVINGLIYQDPIRQGEIAVMTIYKYIAERKLCKQDILVRPQLVLRSNFRSYL